MHSGYLLSTVLLVTLPNIIFSTKSLQYKLAFDKEAGNEISKAPELFENNNNKHSYIGTSHKIRKALRSLLKLNDKDLNEVFQETSKRDETSRKAPISAFFHHASERNMQRLKNLLSSEHWDDQASFETDIVKEDSTDSWKPDSKHYEGLDVESNAETFPVYEDKILLEELDRLSAYLDKKTKDKGRGMKLSHKRKRHSHHYARKEAYYQYWLQSGTCTKSSEGLERVHCPTPTKSGEWVCVDDQELCDGYSHCPNDEDENPKACLFYKTVHNYLEFFSTAVLTAIRRH